MAPERRPLCVCHDEPMWWSADPRYTAGGFHKCAVKSREASARRHAKNRDRYLQQRRDRYDRDPFYRIEKCLRDAARRRALTLKRRKERCGSLGS